MPADEQDFWPHHPHVSSVVIYCCCCWCINPILGFFRIGHGPIILPTLSHASCPRHPLLLPSMDDPFSRADPSATVAAPGTHGPTHEVPKPGKKKRKAKQIKNKSIRLVLVGLCLEWWNLFLTVSSFLFLPFPPISKDTPKLCRLLQAFRSFVSTANE